MQSPLLFKKKPLFTTDLSSVDSTNSFPDHDTRSLYTSELRSTSDLCTMSEGY
ncbi:uncharacterized protein PHALS_09363 [Plasmopara halstedii]|uniref:Uncharacterized protein n=1 Tax=Plasmopara halstedii TaxID=4781 RepID=A0A0P1AES9_PLAHL|nr:uncharacterized protein PHALS_09363 [Plasmopara halstedii]CEG39314.1 hypothetical protein PHALS_09363 [Plasmopara halstedii]|eukprot:XP_024575683.1 hypothetical protein PHALS_09363 [Plasmopara halstedii]